MKSLPKFPVALMSAMSGAVLLVFALRSHAVPENPAVDCGCCECYDLDGLTLYAGGTEVSSDSTEDCTDVSPDEEGQISLDLELPGPDDDCETCDETSLKVRVEDADGKSQQVETPGNLDTAEWKSPLTITVRCMKSGDSQGAPCKTFKICFGDCEDDCDTCPGGSDSTSGAGQPTGQNGSVQFSIPVGRSGFGRSNAQLFAHLGTTDNPGPSALKLTGWDGITKTTDGSGVIQSVTTESCHAVVAAAPTVTDPNAYTITLSYNPANPTTIANSVFRVVTVEELAGGIFQVTTTHGATISSVMRWWKTGSDWSFSQGTNSVITDGLRKVERFYLVNTDTVIKNRFKTYELDPDAPTPSYLLVSDEIKEFHRIGGAWKIVKLQKDPDGANLVSRWTYYLGGELTGPGSYAGTGDLKDYDRHDGYFERHTYAEFGEKGRQHMVTMPYAGTTMTRTTWWDPDTGEMAVTDALASGGVLAHSEVFWSRPTGYIKKTVRKYTGPSTYLDTSYYYHEAGSGKGNQLSRVAWPNGTGTIYDYALDGNLHRIFTEDTGKVSAGAVVEGTRKVTRKNRDGNVEETLVTAISAGAGNGTVLEHWLATAWDLLGRPTTIAWFPTLSTTWTTTRTYACCGLESETDKYGILTQNKYDAMGRRIRTNRLGVTEAVKYAGLTVSRYRYPETVTGGAFGSTLINEISRSVSNVAGTVSESWGPSPQTGALVKLSTETTTYRNPIGTVVDLGGVAIGQKVVKEVIQVADDGSIVPKQSSLYYRGGKLYRSWGDLEPATELSYGVVSALQFTTQSFIENVSTSGTGGTLRESRYTYVDRGGRLARRLQPGREDTYFHYNTLGQLERTVDADGVNTRYAYNVKGERTVTANKLDSTTGSVTWGTDRTVSVETLPATRGSSPAYHVWRTITKVWKDGDTSSSGGTVVSTEDRSTDGLRTWTSRLGVANEQTATVSLAGGGDWTVESVASDGSKTFVTYLDGLWDKTEAKNSGDSVIASTSARDASNSRGYDTLNRPTHRKDSRTGVTETGYRSAISNVIVSTIPPAGSGQATAYAYDHRGRRTTVDAPQSDDAASNELNNITVTAHWASGLVKQVSGDQAYPVTYTYDYAGRMQTMTTSSAAGDAVTKWLYSEASGLLGGKLYNFTDDATVNEYGPTYTYTAAGRLQTRSWVREVSAGVKLKSTYGYTHGLLTSIDYNDSTPDVAYNYDAFSGNNDHMPGTLETATRDGATWTYKYNGTTLRLESETHPVGGTSVERVLTRSYDTHGRSDGFDLGTSGDVDEDFSVVYGFDTAGRLDEVAAAGRTFTYGYTTNSYGLVGTVDGPNDILVTNTWDPNRDVLAVKKNELASDTVSQFTYSVNDLGQRTGVATTGGAFQSTSPGWAWGYDALGQVTEAVHGGLPATLNRSYLYDSIGNRLSVTDGIGTTSDTLDYIPNGLNQYAVIDPGSHYPLYDLDGNLQEDAGINAMGYGLKFEWDAENRMTVARKADNTLLATYKYDHRGRRIRKTTTAAASGGAKDIGYLYDGWNVVTEYEIDSGPAIAPYRAYTWGLDLSGSLQGAGGVGGLLCVHGGADTDGSGNRVWQDGYYPTYDGNGNISEYITDDGYESAPHFEYDASGRIITSSGLGLADFAYRFSTKPMDFETGLCYYGYRYYDQTTGRWLSKDPLGEKGGINLYGFVSNRSLARIDGLGLQGFEGQPAADNPLFDDLDPNRPKEGEEGYVKPKEEGPSLLPNNNTLPDPPAPPQPPNIKNYSTGHYICRRKNQGYRGDESGENCINGHCEYDCTLDGQRPKQGDAPDFAKIEFEFRHCFDCPPTQNQWGYNDFRSLDSICPNVIELKLELFEHEHMGDVFNAPEVPENKPPRNWNL